MADTKAKPYGDVKYADPKNGKYPIDTEEHIRAAWSYINMPKNASAYPLNGVTLSEVKARIKAAMKGIGAEVSDGGDGDGDRSWEWLPLTTGAKPELRGVSEDGTERIGGYAAVFGKLSKTLRDAGTRAFVEVVAPGAFNEARSQGWDGVMCRFNHKDDEILGRVPRTLDLTTDNVGLDYVVSPPPGHRIIEQVRRGDIAASSFAFYCAPENQEWGLSDQDFPMRTLHSVDLIDVAPVTTPAYPDATAGLRSLAAHVGAEFGEVRSMAAAGDLKRFFIRTDRPSYQPPKPKVSAAAAMMQLMERRRDPFIGQD